MAINDIMLKTVDLTEHCVFRSWKFFHYLDPWIWGVRRRMKSLSLEGEGKDLFIILNGPSLKNQELKTLKGKNLMFVNRGFMHPDYKELQPKYHVFVDSKLRDGQWPLEWLDEIFNLSPNTKIIMPIEWYTHPRFKLYKNDERVFWMFWQVPFFVLGVSGGCFSYAIYQKFKNIFFTGFDATSCAHDMLQSANSHFYGVDPELKEMTSKQHAMAMFSTSLHFIDINRLGEYCKRNKINIYNLTDGGLLDMFPRRAFINPYKEL